MTDFESGKSYATPIGPRWALRESKELLHIDEVASHVTQLNTIYDSLVTKLTAALSTDDYATTKLLTVELAKVSKLKAEAINPTKVQSINLGSSATP